MVWQIWQQSVYWQEDSGVQSKRLSLNVGRKLVQATTCPHDFLAQENLIAGQQLQGCEQVSVSECVCTCEFKVCWEGIHDHPSGHGSKVVWCHSILV